MPLLRGRKVPLLDDPRRTVRVVARLLAATAAAALALFAIAEFQPVFSRPYYFPAFAAIVLVSVIIGTASGLLTATLTAIGQAALFVSSPAWPEATGSRELVAVAGDCVTGLLIAWIAGALKGAHARLRAQHDLLQTTFDQREGVVRALTHDLRNPLSVVANHARMLLRDPNDRSDVSRRAEAIDASAARIAVMLQELVDAVQLESGNVPLDTKVVDLATFAAELRERIADGPELDRVQVAIPPGLPPVRIDPARFERVLVNLITNALKYAPAPTPVVLGAAARPDQIVLSVADHGPGIAPSDAPRVFEKYFRAAGAQSHRGLGLGLFITRKLVEAHGGRIWFDSAPGDGTTFFVSLPFAEDPQRGGAGARAPTSAR